MNSVKQAGHLAAKQKRTQFNIQCSIIYFTKYFHLCSKGVLISHAKVQAAAATDHICYMKIHNLLKQ